MNSTKFKKKANLETKEVSLKRIEQVKKISYLIVTQIHLSLLQREQSKTSLIKTQIQPKMKAQLKI
jgi:hypothetical protein